MPVQRVLTLWSDDQLNDTDMEVLRRNCREVALPLTPEDQNAIRALVETFLERGDCSGLAAPQIGIARRIIVFRNKGFDVEGNHTGQGPVLESDYDLLINPRITQSRGDKVTLSEGCLSCPDVHVDVERFPEIKVRAVDRQGKKISRRYTDFIARIAQHEMDHLDGKLIVDYGGALYYPKKKQKFFSTLFR